jgi:hypothetical protein
MDIKDIYSFFTMKLPMFNKGFLESHSIFKSPFLRELNINIHQYLTNVNKICGINVARYSHSDVASDL